MLEIVFIVPMLFWLFGGGFVAYDGTVFNARTFGGYTLVPRLCVAILGYVIFSGAGVAPAVIR